MDRVRFGRALGKGARQLVRTAMEAADAATASEPSRPAAAGPAAGGPAAARPAAAQPEVIPPGRPGATRRVAMPSVAPLGSAVRAAGSGMLPSLKRASRELWLEVTGCFFALFALSFGVGVWKTRADAASAVAEDRQRFALICVLFVLFAYFSVSSFVRARRPKRG